MKGISPEIGILCVRVIINKRSFEPFVVVVCLDQLSLHVKPVKPIPDIFSIKPFFPVVILLKKKFLFFLNLFSAHTLRKLQTEN